MRFSDIAFTRHNDDEYTDDALFLAMLLRANGPGGRNEDNEIQVAKLLNDPNLEED